MPKWIGDRFFERMRENILHILPPNSVLSGTTPREAKRKVITEDVVYLTRGQRFRNVFGGRGPLGLLHFITPFLPFESPRYVSRQKYSRLG